MKTLRKIMSVVLFSTLLLFVVSVFVIGMSSTAGFLFGETIGKVVFVGSFIGGVGFTMWSTHKEVLRLFFEPEHKDWS